MFISVFLISATPCGSSPFIGSSRIRSLGFPISASPIPNLCFIPSENFFAFFLPAFSSPIFFKMPFIYSSLYFPRKSAFALRLSYAFKFSYNPGSSRREPIFSLTLPIALPDLPMIVIFPPVGVDKPVINFINVVLPAPFLPTSP